MNKRKESLNEHERAEREEIAAALEGIRPQTEMGERLIELSRRGLETGVEPLNADGVLEYLGREPYEDVR